MKFKQRVDSLAKGIAEIKFARGEVRICFQEFGQTKEQAMAAAGIEPDDDCLIVFIIKWCRATHEPLHRELSEAKPKPTLEQINSEIEQVKKELLVEGLSGREIAEIETEAKKGSQDPEQEKSHEAGSQPLEVKPMVSELGRMFNK